MAQLPIGYTHACFPRCMQVPVSLSRVCIIVAVIEHLPPPDITLYRKKNTIVHIYPGLG